MSVCLCANTTIYLNTIPNMCDINYGACNVNLDVQFLPLSSGLLAQGPFCELDKIPWHLENSTFES